MIMPIISRSTTTTKMEEISEKTTNEYFLSNFLMSKSTWKMDRQMNLNHHVVSNLLLHVYHKFFVYPDPIKSKEKMKLKIIIFLELHFVFITSYAAPKS
jgi:hypothetical protein